MLEVITTGSHSLVGSQTLGNVRLFDVLLWQLFELISHLRLQLEFTVLFHLGLPDTIVQQVQIWRVWGHSFF